MIELLNAMQPQVNVDGLKGQAQPQADVAALENAEGENFKSLLEQAKNGEKSNKDLLELLSKNYEGNKGNLDLQIGTKTEGHFDKLTEGKTEVKVDSDVETLLGDAKKEAANTSVAPERKSFFPNSKEVSSNTQKPQTLDGILNKKPAQLKIGNTGEVPKEALDLKQTIDPKLAPKLDVGQLKQGQVKTQMQYSGDFMSTKMMQQQGNAKPHITGSKKALNIFTTEQEALDGGNLITKNAKANIKATNMNFDNKASEMLNTTVDKAAVEQVSMTDLADTSKHQAHAPKLETATATTIAATGSETKVVNLSNVENPNQLLKEISNYIETSRIQNGKELEVIVNHKDLGQFKVNASKAQGNMIELQITAASEAAHEFFNKNEISLLKTLSTGGIKVADFKLAMSDSSSASSSGGNDSSGQDFSGNGQGSEGKFSRGENSSDQGRQKRQELWDHYRERMSA